MAIGTPYDVIMDSTLWELQAFDRSHEHEVKEHDYMNYLLGQYQFIATSASLANMFSGKNRKTLSYRDVCKKPVLSDISMKTGELTEDAKKRAQDLHYHRSEIADFNIRLAQMRKELRGGGAS